MSGCKLAREHYVFVSAGAGDLAAWAGLPMMQLGGSIRNRFATFCQF
jgi:hypothetical protein